MRSIRCISFLKYSTTYFICGLSLLIRSLMRKSIQATVALFGRSQNSCKLEICPVKKRRPINKNFLNLITIFFLQLNTYLFEVEPKNIFLLMSCNEHLRKNMLIFVRIRQTNTTKRQETRKCKQKLFGNYSILALQYNLKIQLTVQ